MVLKIPCPTMQSVEDLEAKDQPDAIERVTILRLRETLEIKHRQYRQTLPKYNGDFKDGHAWCAEICYHAVDYNVETFAAEDVKFMIYRTIEVSAQTRELHLESGTLGFRSLDVAKYQEDMLIW